MASASGIRMGKVFVEIGADPSKAIAAFANLEKQVGKIGKSMTSVGARLTAIGTAAMAPFAGAVVAGGRYQDVLNNIQASTGVTADQLGRLRAASMQMSDAMGQGPTAVASSFLELLKAGMSVEQVLGGAGQAAIEFAAVGQMQVADAAVVMADAMKVFGVDAAKAGNTISSAADASSTSIELMSQSFAQVANVAALANQSIDDTSAALAILANNGVKGSDAGTSMKTMLMRIMAPADDAVGALQQIGLSVDSFRGADGRVRPLVEIIGTLNRSMAGMGQAAKDDIFRRLFGSDAIRAAAILTTTGVDGFNQMNEAMRGALPVSEKYKTLMSGLSGAGKAVFAALERMSIAISDAVTPAVMDLAKSVLGAINWLTFFARSNPQVVEAFAKTAAAAVAAGGAFTGLGLSLRVMGVAFGGFVGLGKAIVAPLAAASNAAMFLGKSFSVAGIQLAGFASRGIAAVAQFAAEATAKMAISAAKSGAVAANYFAGTISIMSATVARAAEGNIRAAAIGVQAMAKLGASGVKSFLLAGAEVARLTTVGGTQLARLGVQGSTAIATIGVASTKTGALTLASFAKSMASMAAYAAASIGSAIATGAAWAAANVPLLALVGVVGGAILVVSQLTSLVSALSGVVKDSLNKAVSDSFIVFDDLKRIAMTTFGAVSDALAAGDMALAMETAMAGVVAGFTRGANALMSKVDETAANILNTWDAFKSIAANPLMMFESIKDPFVEADRKALRERQDNRLAKVGENDAARAGKAAAAEGKVLELAAIAGAKRADADTARQASDRLSSAKTLQDVELARQMIARLVDAGNLTGEAEQRLMGDFQAKFAEMSRPASAAPGNAQDLMAAAAGVPMGDNVGDLVGKIAGATTMKQLGSAGKKLSDMIEQDKLSIEEENFLLDHYRSQQDRLANMEGMQIGASGPQSEAVGTFSANLDGLGFGSSLAQKQLDELRGIHNELRKDNGPAVQE